MNPSSDKGPILIHGFKDCSEHNLSDQYTQREVKSNHYQASIVKDLFTGVFKKKKKWIYVKDVINIKLFNNGNGKQEKKQNEQRIKNI